MAKPCLQKSVETTFKSKMGLPMNCKGSILELINSSSYSQQDIVQKTGIPKQEWLSMCDFLTVHHTRNYTIHQKRPDDELVEWSFDSEKSKMTTELKNSFSKIVFTN